MRSQAPSPKPQTTQRFSEIDSLRAVACALVVFAHSAGGISSSILSELARGGGVYGVLLFFAISGYVVPSSLRGERWVGLKRFAIRRFWRLYPPLWFTLIVVGLGVKPSVIKDGSLIWGLTMIPSLAGAPLVQGPFWTLEIELVFYITVAFLFLILGHLNRVIIGACYLSFVSLYLVFPEDIRGLNYWDRLPLYLAIMFYGAFCRKMVHNDAFYLGASMRSIVLGLATGLLAIWPIQIGYLGLIERDSHQLTASALLLAVVCTFLFWIIIRPVKITWLSHVGRCTYSTYLLHLSIIYWASKMLTWLPAWGYIMVSVSLSFVVGAVAYRWIEQPSDRIGKRLTQRLR